MAFFYLNYPKENANLTNEWECENERSLVEKLFVNPNCHSWFMLQYIAESIGLPSSQAFEICDSDGNLKFLKSLQPWDCADELFIPRRDYFVVLISLIGKDVKYSVHLPKTKFALELENKIRQFLINRRTDTFGTRARYPQSKIPRRKRI